MSFFGLNIATQGLYSSRQSLNVTTHNIANAETDGYSRQRAMQSASRPMSFGGSIGMYGTGSEITGIKRMRDSYYDYKFWNSTSLKGEHEIKSSTMIEIEKMFLEPSDNGFVNTVNGFFDSLQDLSKYAGDDSYKAKVVGKATSLAAYYNTVSNNLSEHQRSLNEQVGQYVNRINSIANQVSNLNKEIHSFEMTGEAANDLRDARDLLVDELSKIVSVDVSYKDDQFGFERMELKINGETLVNHDNNYQLEVVEREYRHNPEDIDGLYDVAWANGNSFDLNHSTLSGELKGIIAIRDGNNGNSLKGEVKSVTATSIKLSDVNRLDFPKSGGIKAGTKEYKYTDISYDEATGDITLLGVTPTPDPDPILDPGIPKLNVGEAMEVGKTIPQKGVAYYISKLNEFARTLAKEVNTVHKKGQLKNGDLAGNFFSAKHMADDALDANNDFAYSTITASNLMVDSAIESNIDNFSTTYATSTGESANQLVIDMMKLKEGDAFEKSDPINYMEMLIAEVGTDSKKEQLFASNQESINHTIQNQRRSISSVDLNEESLDMVRYQQVYNVAARMISVFDEILDVTINMI